MYLLVLKYSNIDNHGLLLQGLIWPSPPPTGLNEKIIVIDGISCTNILFNFRYMHCASHIYIIRLHIESYAAGCNLIPMPPEQAKSRSSGSTPRLTASG